MNSVINNAIHLGAKKVDKSSIIIEDDVILTEEAKTFIGKIEWPKNIKYRWKDKDSEVGLILYSLDFSGPIELVTEEHYNNKKLVGCVVLASTEHGQLVIPPSEMKSTDPIVWFLDNDDEDEYKKWQKIKMKLSLILKDLVVQGE